MSSSAITRPRTRVVDAFQSAALTIGPLEPGMSLFALTRGQFSMVDAIRYLLGELGSGCISLWPRTVAVSRGDYIEALRLDARVTSARLVFKSGDERKNVILVAAWQSSFGPQSVVHCRTHAKIATVEGGGLRFLLRGSLNLGVGSRFEQFDLSEGDAAFAMVRRVEEGLPAVACVALPAQARLGGW